ncbi:MAG TPA: PEGA domain-containing protein, partial [Kofleriaceae bacterium]|nr:PEGA domain-containing protein [Kofleriaceae bacterium]
RCAPAAPATEPSRPAARGLQEAVAAPTARAARSGKTPRPRTTTNPPRTAPSPTAPTPPRGVPSGSIAPNNQRIDTAEPDGGCDTGQALGADMALGSSPRDALVLRGITAPPTPAPAPPATAAPAPRRARSATSPGTGSSGPRRVVQTTGQATVASPVLPAGPRSIFVADSQPADRRPARTVEDLGAAADTMPTIPSLQNAETVVRFRPATLPPLDLAPLTPENGATIVDAATIIDGATIVDGAPLRLITPATELFAEPDPELDGIAAVPPSAVATTDRDVAPQPSTTMSRLRDRLPRRAIWRMAVILLALALVGAAVTAGALSLLRGRRAPVAVKSPPPPAANTRTTSTVGTIQFAVTPVDSAITIDGKPMHQGTPWDVELAPGPHQIEIHHDGYKVSLSQIDLAAGQVHPLQASLEPLGGTATDATLSIVTNPPGLSVVLDGAPAGKSPLKLIVPPGSHNVIVRRNGADAWRKTVTVQANVVHEIRPVVPDRAPADPTAPPGALHPTPDPAPR